MMEYPLLEFFSNRVLPCTVTNRGNVAYPASFTSISSHSSSEDQMMLDHTSGRSNKTRFGVENGLLELVQRVAALHIRARFDAGPNLNTIMDAISLWQILSEWQPPTPEPSPEYEGLSKAYLSALFIWLHLITHPDQMSDPKIQEQMRRGLEEASTVTDHDLVPLLVIPVFVWGQVSLQNQDRIAVAEQLARIEPMANLTGVDIGVFRIVAQRSWDFEDKGGPRSWEWQSWIG